MDMSDQGPKVRNLSWRRSVHRHYHTPPWKILYPNFPTFRPNKKIKAIAMGGDFTNSDMQPVCDVLTGARNVAWLRSDVCKPGAGPLPTGPPSAEAIAARPKKALMEYADEVRGGGGGGAGEVWYF